LEVRERQAQHAAVPETKGNQMSKTFKIVNGDISDGYHTFDELYEHRCLLFLALCNMHPDACFWKPDYENWFILYWESPAGQISYHLPKDLQVSLSPKIKLDPDHRWDGHTSDGVLDRLLTIAEGFN
jgi:hypothetical protein